MSLERLARPVARAEQGGAELVQQVEPSGVQRERRRHDPTRVITAELPLMGPTSSMGRLPRWGRLPRCGERPHVLERTAMSQPSSRPPIAFTVLTAVTALLFVVALYTIFFHAQVEARMGIVQKIFYFHVPSAYAMYLGFAMCAIGSIVYLVKRTEGWDAVAVAGAEVGLLFCIAMLITGPLWARKAWGVWWTWDPRLTSTLLAGMIFTAYVVLRSFGGGEAERRFAAALGIVGALDIPVIHYAVQRWRGTHPTVITNRGGGITAEMGHALIVSLVLFTALFALLAWIRIRQERTRQALRSLELEAAERGILEDI
ncbi:MAG: cytochrome c biogenesis protein [Sandaracinaceae bacterium]